MGKHLYLGCAGENILINSQRLFSAEVFQGSLFIRTNQGSVELHSVIVATPCAPFAGWTLGKEQPSASEIKSTLQCLNHGIRGFYARYQGAEQVIRVGDEVKLRE
ncbi:MAG: MOSC domain-containing protein [Trueperaceae bacterium]